MNAKLYDASFAIAMLLVIWSFYHAQRDPSNNFNLFDLIIDGGKVSRIGFAYLVGLLVSSWVLIKMVENEARNIDVVFSAYLAAWVIPIVSKLFSPPAPSGTVTTQTSATVTQTVDRDKP
jgi:hypothetical protein